MAEVADHKIPEVHTEVDVKLLKVGMSPRFGEQDIEHARALAHTFDECPPILVERGTLIVIDGVHRMLAARMLGRSKVTVRFFDGTHDEAYVEAVRSNIAHGKPLTLAERESAAKTILGMHSDWSDRLVGRACGLSGKTVGRLRKATAEVPQSSVRLGRDGRFRPIDSKHLRSDIAAAIRASPTANAVELAQSLATSPSTVRDVRKRIERGEPINSTEQVPGDIGVKSTVSNHLVEDVMAKGGVIRWSTDNAMMAMPGGNEFVRWLDGAAIDESNWENQIGLIPIGRIPQLIVVAKSRAGAWNKLAASLEERARQLNRRQ